MRAGIVRKHYTVSLDPMSGHNTYQRKIPIDVAANEYALCKVNNLNDPCDKYEESLSDVQTQLDLIKQINRKLHHD